MGSTQLFIMNLAWKLGLWKTSEAVPGVVPYFCATSLNSPLSWPPPSLVSLLSASLPCCAIVDAAPVIARPPAAVPGAGRERESVVYWY